MDTKKIQHLMTTICQSSAVDTDTNSLSLFNIIEEINVNLKPLNNQLIDQKEKKSIPFPFELVSVWTKLIDGDVSSEIKFSLIDPLGEVIQEIPHNLEIKSTHQRMRIRIKVNGIVVTKPGQYFYLVELKSKNGFTEVSKIPLTIKIPVSTDLNIFKK